VKKYQKKYQKLWWQRNRERHMRNTRKNKAKRREFIYTNFKSKPCMDCGGSFPPECMQFDHRPGTIKSFSVSSHGLSKSLDKLLAEIEKCDVVCANCHAIRTVRRGQHIHGRAGHREYFSYSGTEQR
jgi:hypothetical protein